MSCNPTDFTFLPYLDARPHSMTVGQRLCLSSFGLRSSALLISTTLVNHSLPPLPLSLELLPNLSYILTTSANSPGHNSHAALSSDFLDSPRLIVFIPEQEPFHAPLLDDSSPHPHHLSPRVLHTLPKRRKYALTLLMVPHSRA